MRIVTRRRANGVWIVAPVVCLGPPVGAAHASASSVHALELIRARVWLVSAYRTLADVGALPPVLRSSAAPLSRPSLVDFLAFKRRLTRFARSSGMPAVGGDIGVGTSPRDENEPTVAADPRDEDVLVAGSHSFDPVTQINHCVAYASRDGGASWSSPLELPQLTSESFCSDPVLAYAPDGRRVYYAYLDVKVSESIVGDPENPAQITVRSEIDVLVSGSGDRGTTWSPPVVALDGDPSSVTFIPETGEVIDFEPGSDFDKPWIATHVPVKEQHSGNAGRVHLSATRFDTFNPGMACAIVATQSSDRGAAWAKPMELDSSGGDCLAPVSVQGSRASGGLGDDMLVAWYQSGSDGWLKGSFEIRAASSSDGGHRFQAPVTVATDTFEAPFFLGPFEFYHRWWGTMWPDVEIAPDGRAHIVYAHDPEENGVTERDPVTGEEVFLPEVSTTAEDGDIRYIRSARRAYGSGAWSAPETLNDDGLVRAQGYPALEISGEGPDAKVHVIWEDHRLSPEVPVTDPLDPAQFQQSSNRYFDMFTTRRDEKTGWSPNARLTDRSSISDFVFIGDYNDLTTSGEYLVFGIWTDRRHQSSTGAALDPSGSITIDEAALEDNVFGDHLGDRD
jgi:hypothetical protein